MGGAGPDSGERTPTGQAAPGAGPTCHTGAIRHGKQSSAAEGVGNTEHRQRARGQDVNGTTQVKEKGDGPPQK